MKLFAAVMKLFPSRRPLPLSVVYPFVGGILALALAAGLLALRLLASDAPSLVDELRAGALVYAYVVLSNGVLLGVLGYALGAKEDQLWSTSLTDPLTQIANRRHFESALEEELGRAQASGMPLALLMADLDHLKTINDTCGHAGGDAALRALAEVISSTSRSRDLTARFGGDEFVIVMPRTRATEAWALAERIRASLETQWAQSQYKDRIPALTVSIGIADLEAAPDMIDPSALFEAADRALYQAKSDGRNRSVVASQLDDTLVAARPVMASGFVEGNVCVAPGMAPTYCDDAHVHCVSGTYASPACGAADFSGTAAVLESGTIVTHAPEADNEAERVAWPELKRSS